MKAVIALGNPGARYEATRHNIGWMVADVLATRLGSRFQAGRGDYYQASATLGDHPVLVIKPTTYMNNSGLAAEQVAGRFGIEPADMLVVVDELQFPVGRIQLKPSGSSAGHNGTESVIYHLGTAGFPRLRCGVGGAFGQGEMVEYVLASFPDEEKEIVETMIAAAADAVILWITEGTARAMNQVNRSATEPTAGPENVPRDDAERHDQRSGAAEAPSTEDPI